MSVYRTIGPLVLIFAQNIDFGHTVLTSTRNLCFGAKIIKMVYPCIPHFCYIKVGYEGVYISQTFLPDDKVDSQFDPPIRHVFHKGLIMKIISTAIFCLLLIQEEHCW